jgi:hypothetical protein
MATKFTYFTRPDGTRVYVNVDNLVRFAKATDLSVKGNTILYYTNGEFNGVMEDVERVLATLRSNEQT